jgi:peptide-methionine (R)-S-oxide reductase
MNTNKTDTNTATNSVIKTDGEWRAELTPAQYEVLRQKGTEPPFTGSYVYEKRDGTYRCAACGTALFDSSAKFDSGTGWPSFTEPSERANVELRDDFSYGMHRVEVNCAACGGHLGHVFDDGPGETGQRYCIISVSLKLEDSDSE